MESLRYLCNRYVHNILLDRINKFSTHVEPRFPIPPPLKGSDYVHTTCDVFSSASLYDQPTAATMTLGP
uniref:Uncharacterized protein n=1 Tax=Coccidioides posadasii RMSCC 3488 TaxID=454284 RepID=A0A0J6FHK3_COCPO|nr:hypothetical protein CPAG_05184 [Coccidioides posadasii RMSCC 3488]